MTGTAFALLAVAARLTVAGGAAFGAALTILAGTVLTLAVLALAAHLGGVMAVGAVGVEQEEPVDDRAAARRSEHGGHDGKAEGTRERFHGEIPGGRTFRAGTPPAADHPHVTGGIGRAAGAG
jgi:hypothetical protein